MMESISTNYPYDLPFYEQRSFFIERKKLLSSLLSRRNALRVICAPALYGKSVLAFQYADRVFQQEAVRWIDASDPMFLLELDRGASANLRTRYLDRDKDDQDDHMKVLFVIDDCPYLEEERFNTLQSLLGDALLAGHEVILTTSDTRWIELRVPNCCALDAHLLLLDNHEQVLLLPDAVSDSVAVAGHDKEVKSEAGGVLLQIVGCASDVTSAHRRFVSSLMNRDLYGEAEALSLVMLLLGSGALHELRGYTKDLSNSLLTNIERRYPHAGITALSPLFVAVELSEYERFLLLRRHLSALKRLLAVFDSEEDLVATLIEHLMKRDCVILATQLACGLHDDSKRGRFFDEHAGTFLFKGKLLALLSLANTMPPSFFTLQTRWPSVVLALGLLDERDLALRVMRSFKRAVSAVHDKGSTQVGGSAHPSSSMELDAALVRIIIGITDQDERRHIDSLIQSRIDYMDANEEHPRSRPLLTQDILVMLGRTLKDPLQGCDALQKLLTSGHSIKESLIALCFFVSVLLFAWPDHLEHGSSPPSARSALPQEPRSFEKVFVKLERQLAHIFSRQASLLPPNSAELYLFDKAQLLFGERLYLLVGDPVLNRIGSFRSELSFQRERWRTHHLAGALMDPVLHEDKQEIRNIKQKVLRINTLGRFEIEAHDPQIVIKSKVRKQLRLLISLMAINSGREVARPWIQRIMWPEAPERNARQNLYTMWSMLNKSVVDQEGNCPFFESYPQSLSLNTRLVETDTQLLNEICRRLRYETLDIPLYEKAIEQIEDLYRGPLLPGNDTAEIVAYRKKCQDRLIEALLKGGEHLRKCGETSLALRYFRFAFDNEPTREDICYQLMLSLWKLGRHGEALGEYFVCRRALIDEFGIEGTGKLRELYETILDDAS